MAEQLGTIYVKPQEVGSLPTTYDPYEDPNISVPGGSGQLTTSGGMVPSGISPSSIVQSGDIQKELTRYGGRGSQAPSKVYFGGELMSATEVRLTRELQQKRAREELQRQQQAQRKLALQNLESARKQAQAQAGKSQIQKRIQEQAQRQKQLFSGVVEESFKGTPQEKKFFIKGKEVGKVTYTGKQPSAEVYSPAKITTPRGTYELGKEGIVTTQIRQPDIFDVGRMDAQILSQGLETPLGYKQYVKDYGPISGTLRYAGEKSKKLIPKQGLDIGDYKGYEIRGTAFTEPETRKFVPAIYPEEKALRELTKTQLTKEAFATTITSVPYFTPAGPSLLIVGGVEQIAYKKSRGELYASAEQLGLPKETGLLLPVAQIGLGALGIKKQFKGFQSKQELKAFQKAPTKYKGLRVEGEKGGLDVLYGYKEAGKTKYLTKIEQPFYKVDTKRILFEEGKGVTLRIPKKGKIDVLGFEVSGRAQTGAGSKQVIKRFAKVKGGLLDSPVVTKISPVEAEAMFGRVSVKEVFKGTYKIKKGISLPTGKYKTDIIGKIKYIKEPSIEKFNIFGFGKQEGGKILFAGGELEKLRYYPSTGKVSLIAKKSKLTDFGVIKRFTTPKDTGVDFIKQSLITKTKFTTAPIIGKISQKVIPKVPTIIKVPSITGLITSTKVKGKVPTIIKQTQELKQLQKQEIKLSTIQKLDTTQISKEKLKLPSILSLGEKVITKQKTRQVQVPKLEETQKQISKQVSKLKQIQQLRTPYVPFITTIPITKIPKIPKIPIFKLGFFKQPKVKQRGLFGVQIRRQKKWKTIGAGLSLKQALSLGRGKVETTLARSLRLTGGGIFGTPKGYRRGKKEKNVLIQLSKYSLSAPTEKSEIQLYRKIKKKRKPVRKYKSKTKKKIKKKKGKGGKK